MSDGITIGTDTELRRLVDKRVAGLVAWAQATCTPDTVVVAPFGTPEGRQHHSDADGSYTAADLVAFLDVEQMAHELELDIRLTVRDIFGPDQAPSILIQPFLVQRWPLPAGRSPWAIVRETQLDASQYPGHRAWWTWWRLAIDALERSQKPPEGMTSVLDQDSPVLPYLLSWNDPPSGEAIAAWARRRGFDNVSAATAPFVPQMGVLCRAEEQRTKWTGGQPLRDVVVPTDSVTVGTFSYLGAEDGLSTFWKDSQVDHHTDGIEITWRPENKAPVQLKMFSPDTLNGGVFGALHHWIGADAVAHALSLLVMTWAARARPLESAWIWPTEALELQGLSTSKLNLAKWRASLETLSRVELCVRVKGSNRPAYRGPVCHESRYRNGCRGKSPVLVTWHPVIMEALTRSDGTPGSTWIGASSDFLSIRPGRAGDPVHLVAMATGRQFYSKWARSVRQRDGYTHQDLSVAIRANLLASYAGPLPEAKRDKRRIHDRLRRSVSQLLEAEYYGSARWEKDVGPLDAKLVVTPGPRAMAAFHGAVPVLPSYVPATGTDVREFLNDTGRTAGDLATELGLTEANVWKVCQRYRADPLPAAWRARLVKRFRGAP